jgi:hypothetical protein|tara:strand:+ start:1213 stop:1659 length:447 start_codon:yes stop_codon:yes gene_type:complete
MSNCNIPVERCEELVCTNCLSHCYDKFSYELSQGNEIIVDNGERLLSTIQRMVIATAGGDCFKKAPVGLRTSGITSSSINIVWTAPLVAGTYTVQYRLSGASTWTDAATNLTATSYNLICQNAATAYEIRVYASSISCPSVTIYASTL